MLLCGVRFAPPMEKQYDPEHLKIYMHAYHELLQTRCHNASTLEMHLAKRRSEYWPYVPGHRIIPTMPYYYGLLLTAQTMPAEFKDPTVNEAISRLEQAVKTEMQYLPVPYNTFAAWAKDRPLTND